MDKIHDNRPDVRSISIEPSIAFDIRILRDLYGIPQIIDVNSSALVYSNRYEFWGWWLFESDEPEYSEDWYLILRPTDTDNFYTGSKYKLHLGTYSAANDNKKHFGTPPKFKNIDEIINGAWKDDKAKE